MAVSALWSLWLTGQVLRDHDWLTGLCFYIPSPAMAAMALAAGLVAAARKHAHPAMALGVMALPPCALVALVENQWTRPIPAQETGPTMRLVHWNIGYGQWGRAGVERELVRRKASLYVLSEVPRPFDLSELAARLGPGYSSASVGGMAFIADGRLLDARRLEDQGGLKVIAATWVGAWGSLKVFGVDGPSSLLVPRDPVMTHLRSLLAYHRPDLAAGDFNAPRRSRALWPLPEGFAHAYERAGRGWSYTWPAPCPLYAIDQCIVSGSVRPIRYELEGSRYSDHLIQSLEFQLVAPKRE